MLEICFKTEQRVFTSGFLAIESQGEDGSTRLQYLFFILYFLLFIFINFFLSTRGFESRT